MTSDSGPSSSQPADLAHARDYFAAHGRLPEGTHVRDVILQSWRRSRHHAADRAGIAVATPSQVPVDSALVHAAREAVADRWSWLTDLPHALVLTDGEGRVLERWADDPSITAALDGLRIVPGASQSESAVGTSSVGIALEGGLDVGVWGAEHYRSDAADLASAGSPVLQPVTRRVIGTINAYSRLVHASPLMLALVHEVARSVEDALTHRHAEHDRDIVEAYLESIEDSSEPVLCVNEHSIVGNAAAAARLESLDQTMLWELASRTISADGPFLAWVSLADGTDTVAVTCAPIEREGRVVGAVLRPVPSAQAESAHAAHRLLPDLVGASPAWLRLCERIDRSLVERRPMSLVGEPGVGKSAVVAALARSRTTVTLIAHSGSDEAAWLRQVDAAVRSEVELVVMENLHLLSPAELVGTTRALSRSWRTDGPQLLVTWTRSRSQPPGAVEVEWSGDNHEVPALRNRLEDLPMLLDAISRDHGAHIEWSPEAVQALSRVPWAANLRSLAILVGRLTRDRPSGTIRLDHLPAEIRASATHLGLSGLDRVEAQAIAKALTAANGNKKRAADMLGIARSTLYRKIQALGLDLENTTY
ncbi:sigma-54-dependent Fis family transcriptional regulator [Georgenia sp. SYP-B2076]|uniref:sigma-54-dependent Fis family transcriptional regulator n=1 Tax=Georgenia sp. SYP-B2076 TaxID=2495881 RepID=UPI000F8EAE73|nr:helix-turn-helix domain-containing protein [Georgenia sp. SYP-B2076]